MKKTIYRLRHRQTRVTPTPEGQVGQSGTDAALFERANQEFDAGQYLKALELLDQIIERGTASEVVYNNRGAALDALGRHSDALKAYNEAISLNPRYELAWHNMGNSLLAQEAYDEAASAYAKAADLNPDRMENWSGLASACIRLGRSRKAKLAIDRLSKFAETDFSVLLVQADLYAEAGYLEEAARCCQSYIARRPEAPEGYARLGSVKHDAQEYGKAIEAFERALLLAPENKELWNNLGYTYFVAGNLDKAIECFDRALQIDPQYKNAWYNKAYAYHGMDRLEEALQCYKEALRLDPNDKVLWNNLGNALYNMGRFGESIPYFVEAIRVDPDYEIAWNNIGNALEKMGMYREAIPYHDRSLEISPGFDYALYAKGVCLAMIGRVEEGYDFLLDSLELNPSYEEAWRARAMMAKTLGRYDEALAAIEQAIALNPEFDEAWADRGEMLLAVNDPEAAQASFEMALKCLEGLCEDTNSGLAAAVRRGEVLARLGRFEEALESIESVAVLGKLDSVSIPKALELRRYLGKMELPEGIRKVAASSSDARVRLEYASFLLEAGEAAEAERVLEGTTPRPGLEGELALLKARAKARSGDYAGALRILDEEAASKCPQPALLRGRAEVCEAAGDLPGAIEAYERALALQPSDFASALSLARLYLVSGEPRKALSMTALAIGIDDQDWEPRVIRARAFESLGMKDAAAAELLEARRSLARCGLSADDWLGREHIPRPN